MLHAGGISVDIACPEDADVVSDLLAASYTRLLQSAYADTELSAALPGMIYANPVLLDSGSYFIARGPKRETIGCGGWTHGRPGTGEISPGLGHVRHFGVHPSWTGQGVGRMIFDRCVQQARASGILAFEVYATLNARVFYTALGFVFVRDLDVTLGNGAVLSSIVMRRGI